MSHENEEFMKQFKRQKKKRSYRVQLHATSLTVAFKAVLGILHKHLKAAF